MYRTVIIDNASGGCPRIPHWLRNNPSMIEFEQRILIGCKHGNEECWRKLFNSYYPLAKWVVTHTLYQIDDFTVNSLAQETMVVLVENIKKIDDEHYLKRFIKRVTRNKCIDYIRKNKEQFDEVLEDIQDYKDYMIDNQVVEALHLAVENLQEPCNTIVRTRFLDGISYKELAVKINVDIGQIGVRISRCLKILRTYLEKMNIFWDDVI